MDYLDFRNDILKDVKKHLKTAISLRKNHICLWRYINSSTKIGKATTGKNLIYG